MNLATNSVHAMAAGGTLGIETRVVDLDQEECRHIPEAKPGRYVLLSVSDTGHGMDDETQRHMFEPFFTTKKVGEGTGLGLPVVYGIVQDHGGFLSCSSKVNTGTTFRLYFPAGAAGCAVDSQEGSTHAAQGGSETILLVDDDPSVRTAMKAGFLRLGYTVITAPDGEVGLKRFAEEPRIALVVVDLGMPKLDGWECLRRLKLVDPEVKVLITTGYGGQDLAKRASAHGARDLLPKPFMLNELFWKVRSILDGSGQT
jgi:CheY-like chemotaxis protein